MTKQRTLPAGAIVAAAIGLGFAGDQLIRDSQGPGLNFLLLFIGLATSVWIVKQSGGPSLSREAYGWIWVGLACGAALIWRGSPLLRIAALFGALTAFAIPALRAGRPWVRRAGITAYLEAVAGAGISAAFGSARLIEGKHWGDVGSDASRSTVRVAARSVIGGLLLATIGTQMVLGGLKKFFA